jgi:hypothetical protein
VTKNDKLEVSCPKPGGKPGVDYVTAKGSFLGLVTDPDSDPPATGLTYACIKVLVREEGKPPLVHEGWVIDLNPDLPKKPTKKRK